MKPATTLPPPPAATSGEPSAQIYCRLRFPPIPGYLPSGMMHPAFMMRHILELEFSRAGIPLESIQNVGPLDDSFFLLRVNSRREALQTARAAFAGVVLDRFVEIGWFDRREGIIRLVHPVEKQIAVPQAEIDAKSDACEQFMKNLPELVGNIVRKIKDQSDGGGLPK